MPPTEEDVAPYAVGFISMLNAAFNRRFALFSPVPNRASPNSGRAAARPGGRTTSCRSGRRSGAGRCGVERRRVGRTWGTDGYPAFGACLRALGGAWPSGTGRLRARGLACTCRAGRYCLALGGAMRRHRTGMERGTSARRYRGRFRRGRFRRGRFRRGRWTEIAGSPKCQDGHFTGPLVPRRNLPPRPAPPLRLAGLRQRMMVLHQLPQPLGLRVGVYLHG
jgi:hypothetical protein